MDKKTTTKSQGRSGRSAARTVKDAAGSVAKRTGRAAKNVKDAAKKTVKATDSKSGKADKAGKKAQKGGKHTARKGAARAVAKQQTAGRKTAAAKSEPVRKSAVKKAGAAAPQKVKKAPAKKTTTRKAVADGQKAQPKATGELKIIPLGGLNEIGKNMTALEYGNEMIIVDCGMSFPDDEMYGIDVVLPDFSYLKSSGKKIRGVIITHGHEDHIGAVPYLLKEMDVPIYGTPLPLGLIRYKLEEHDLKGDLREIHAGDKFRLGKFVINAIRTTHSIADSICLNIETPVGRVFHTGDFKIDYTPVDGEPIDLATFADVGSKGVLLLMADSTNATRPGYTKSEKLVGSTLEGIIRRSSSRIIIATFSSNVHRIQKIIDHAVANHRKVAISGRSMEKVVSLAIELGYIKVPDGVLVDVFEAKRIPDKNLIIVTTGSQGEPMSALSRMANNTHRAIQIKQGDQVILSSSPIPGNEKLISNVINRLYEKGAEVIYSDIAETHVSGHACAEELKLVHSLIRPKYFMPVHGEVRHLRAHEEIAKDLGMPADKIFKLENGDCLHLTESGAKLEKHYCTAGDVMVDGLGVGDVGNAVLRDRRLLSEAGLILVVASIEEDTNEIISGPDLISRGFVYVKDHGDLMGEAQEVAKAALEKYNGRRDVEWTTMKNALRDELKKFIYMRTGRHPVILPVFMEV